MRPHPCYVASGAGCRVTDVDVVERLDAINNFTALIHGHGFPPIVEAVTRQVSRGTAFATSTPEEVALAELLTARVPALERVRFGNSGTEAVMMAIKAARAYTGRDRIAKFEGAYHGYYDDVQVSFSSRPGDWGPDDAPASVPSSGGIPKHRVLETLVLPWNDRDATERLIVQHRNELAAVLVDPLSNRMGFIPPADGFLSGSASPEPPAATAASRTSSPSARSSGAASRSGRPAGAPRSWRSSTPAPAGRASPPAAPSAATR
jgi:glutamate-1-semialdehyde 2,1-aminomutase